MPSRRIILMLLIARLGTQPAWSLECYECVGSEWSDCARGVAAAAVRTTCVPRVLRPRARGALVTDAATHGFRPFPAQEPFVPYPACVRFTKLAYNSRNVVVHKACLASGETFCRDYFMAHPEGKCRQCNHSNFCL